MVMIGRLLTILSLCVATATSTATIETISDDPIEGTGYINYAEECNPEKIVEMLNASQYRCQMQASSYVEFKDVNADGKLNLKNPNDFHIQVCLLPYESGSSEDAEVIYESPMLSPGENLEYIRLNRNLDTAKAGKHSYLLYYNCYEKTEDGFRHLGNCGLKVIVNICAC